MTDESTSTYTLTVVLPGPVARDLADADYSGTCASQRYFALLGALRDHGTVESFTRTERHVSVIDLTASE